MCPRIYFDSEATASLCADKLVFKKRWQGYGWEAPAIFFAVLTGRRLFVIAGFCQGRSATKLGKLPVVLASLVGLHVVISFYCASASRIANVRHRCSAFLSVLHLCVRTTYSGGFIGS